jgi:3-oxoacyl-[acyl-carrier-protein] synthase-3
MGIGIVGTGAYLPTQTVTNAEIVENVDTSEEWIVSHKGNFAGE